MEIISINITNKQTHIVEKTIKHNRILILFLKIRLSASLDCSQQFKAELEKKDRFDF
jgi:hypothetical protein